MDSLDCFGSLYSIKNFPLERLHIHVSRVYWLTLPARKYAAGESASLRRYLTKDMRSNKEVGQYRRKVGSNPQGYAIFVANKGASQCRAWRKLAKRAKS